MIVTGAENVYPAEVENALFGHPAIADAAVIGVPDDKWGEAVKAIIVLKPGAPRDADDIIGWAQARIAHFKAPKSVDFVVSGTLAGVGDLIVRSGCEGGWDRVDADGRASVPKAFQGGTVGRNGPCRAGPIRLRFADGASALA